jgi:hypothetical protein
LRSQARKVIEDLSWWLCYDDSVGEWRLEPWGMAWPQYYEYETREILASLPDDVKADYQLQVTLAECAEKLVDSPGYSSICRLDMLDILNQLLDELREAATEYAGADA